LQKETALSTKVSICSNALLLLGAKTINSLDEGSDRASLASNLYDASRDDLLRSHPWNCAVKRVILAPDAEAPAFDYSAQFTLPADWLKTISVGAEGYEVDYKHETGKILCGGTVLPLRYIFRNENEATWDSMLVKAMELKMAADMAYPITMSASLADMMFQKLERHMKRARTVDGQDDPPQTLGDFPLLGSRFGRSGY
jgi:hypothetical protein